METRPVGERYVATHRGAELYSEYLYFRMSLFQYEIEKHVYQTRSESVKRVGKLYGKASRTIAFLKGQLARQELMFRDARDWCTCGAYQKAHKEQLENDVMELQRQLEAQKDGSKYLYQQWMKEKRKNSSGES